MRQKFLDLASKMSDFRATLRRKNLTDGTLIHTNALKLFQYNFSFIGVVTCNLFCIE